MIFHVVAVGRMRKTDLRATCDEYAKRIRRYTKLQIHEVPDAPSTRDRRRTLEGEANKLVSVLDAIPVRVLLTRSGRALTSRAFSDFLVASQHNARDLAFVIGGAYGVHETVAEVCTDQIQLSQMTLPHELARVFLLEQIYRGFSILRSEPYHKGD